MGRADDIYQYILSKAGQPSEGTPFSGVDAGEVATALGIWRNDASAELKKLFDSGKLDRIGKKPVRYFPALAPVDGRAETAGKTDSPPTPIPQSPGPQKAFGNVIGADRSLKKQVDMAKSAVLYPPNGLHMLITGESGVGKSLLAEEIWRFRNEYLRDGEPEKPFVAFNCAEYADNPQLLQSYLFGHVKGAFTGAGTDRDGLVKQADGGILFLDEIHRLSQSGQEMFFMLLDKGIYRRLGETQSHHVNLTIIGATTEDISQQMLQTFRRRMPVLIQLPPLAKRPLDERVDLIRYFLMQEASRLHMPMFLSGRMCQQLLLRETKANVGDLKNAIQICCAKSYCSFLMNPRQDAKAAEPLRIEDSDILSEEAERVFEPADSKEAHICAHVFSRGILVNPMDRAVDRSYYDGAIDLYGYVERQLYLYRRKGYSEKQLQQRVASDLHRYYLSAEKSCARAVSTGSTGLSQLIDLKNLSAAGEILSLAAVHFNRTYSKGQTVALALHLEQLKHREQSGKIISDRRLDYVESKYPDEISFIHSILPQISSLFDITIPDTEVGFLAVFIQQQRQLEAPLCMLIAAHGDSTATSMAKFVNDLLDIKDVLAVDMPIAERASDTVNKICAAVSQLPEVGGLLVLADMGSLITKEKELSQRLSCPCRIIPNVSSALALETARVISTFHNLDDAYKQVMTRYREYINIVFCTPEEKEASIAQPIHLSEDAKPDVIFTVCATGIGSGKKLADILHEKLADIPQLQIQPISVLADIEEEKRQLEGHLVAVAGSFCPLGSDVPFFSTESILIGNGLTALREQLLHRRLIATDLNAQDSDRERAMTLLKHHIGQYAPSFPDQKLLLSRAVTIAEKIGAQLNSGRLTTDLLVRVVLHTASLLERLQAGEGVTMPEWGPNWLSGNRAQAATLRGIINEGIGAYGLEIPDAEIIYFAQII